MQIEVNFGAVDTALTGTAVRELASRVKGSVVQPGDETYDEVRKVWNGMIDKRPALILRCAEATDVVQGINFARERNLPVAVRGGGHNVAGSAVCDGGLMIDLALMKGVHLDVEKRTVRAQPGVTWGELDRASQPYGLAVPGGIVSMTGIAGLTLGGGFGWLTRKHGLTCDSLLCADVVTADGQPLVVSQTENPDLFWGIRGGGGNFGVVTSFEYRLHPVGPDVTAGLVLYPFERAEDVMRFYRDFTAQASENMGSLLTLRMAPPTPLIPQSMHGRPVVGIGVCYAGPLEEGMRAVRPIKALGGSILDTIGRAPFITYQASHDAGQPAGRHYYWKSEYLSELNDDAIDTSIAYAVSLSSPQSAIMFFQLGGAAGRLPEDTMAASHRDAAYVLNINSSWAGAGEPERHVQWTRDYWRVMQPFATGGVYVNFLSADDGQERVRAAYGAAKYDRMVALKNRYDPANLFRMNQNIRPTE